MNAPVPNARLLPGFLSATCIPRSCNLREHDIPLPVGLGNLTKNGLSEIFLMSQLPRIPTTVKPSFCISYGCHGSAPDKLNAEPVISKISEGLVKLAVYTADVLIRKSNIYPP